MCRHRFLPNRSFFFSNPAPVPAFDLSLYRLSIPSTNTEKITFTLHDFHKFSPDHAYWRQLNVLNNSLCELADRFGRESQLEAQIRICGSGNEVGYERYLLKFRGKGQVKGEQLLPLSKISSSLLQNSLRTRALNLRLDSSLVKGYGPGQRDGYPPFR